MIRQMPLLEHISFSSWMKKRYEQTDQERQSLDSRIAELIAMFYSTCPALRTVQVSTDCDIHHHGPTLWARDAQPKPVRFEEEKWKSWPVVSGPSRNDVSIGHHA